VTVALPSPPVCLLAGLESFRDIYHKRLVEMISSSLLENAFDQPVSGMKMSADKRRGRLRRRRGRCSVLQRSIRLLRTWSLLTW
jgi:hypothetical protein